MVQKIISFTTVLLCVWAGAVSAGSVNLPQTGQTICYDKAGTEINCAGTGQDGEIKNCRISIAELCVVALLNLLHDNIQEVS